MVNNGHSINVMKSHFPRCEFPLISTEEFTTLLINRLFDRKATSVVRLGDGEGMVLARPTPGDTTLWKWVCFHFGPKITAHHINGLADMLSCAIESADVIGVRDDLVDVDFHPDNFNLSKRKFLKFSKRKFLRCFRASFRLRSVDAKLAYPHALRLAHLHRFLSTQMFHQDTVFTSAWIHFHLSSSGTLIKIMREQKRIGLITSKPELAKAVEKQLNIKVDYYNVPEIYAATATAKANYSHFPNEFDRTMQALQVAYRGQLFLVGAGICGKVYCHRIKELGGIGLDIGAVCDAWINIPSRRVVFRTLYDPKSDSVPESLLLEYQANNF